MKYAVIALLLLPVLSFSQTAKEWADNNSNPKDVFNIIEDQPDSTMRHLYDNGDPMDWITGSESISELDTSNSYLNL